MSDPVESYVGQQVVLDTATSIIYLGTLVEVTPHALVLEHADVHDCRDGHATKEVYTAVACEEGISMNRRRVVVARAFIMSVSTLSDVALGGEEIGVHEKPDLLDND